MTLREQILVSRIGDDTLRVLCCVLCVACVVGVQCVGVGVCVLVLVLVCHADPPLFPSSPPTSPLSVCTPKTRPVCTFQASLCVPAPRPQVLPHAGMVPLQTDVLNVHTGVFSVPHHTARTHHDLNDMHTRQNNNHNNKRRQGQRDREGETEKNSERETRQHKTREDETREEKRRKEKRREAKRREKMKEKMKRDQDEER